jgi:hypothetical protein
MPWNPEKARQFLSDAAHERAKGPGLSDTSLGRRAALQDPEGAESKAAFIRALQRAGWRPRRITKAVASVVGKQAQPKVSGWRLWTLRWLFESPSDVFIGMGVCLTILSLSALVLALLSHPGILLISGLALGLTLLYRRHRRAERLRIDVSGPPAKKRRVATVEEDEEDIPPVTGRARRRR